MEKILNMLPERISQAITANLIAEENNLEEIRLRLNREVELNFTNRVKWLPDIYFTKSDSIYVLNQLSEYSLYRLEDELREGYITIDGGHRVGLAGEVTTEYGKMKHIQKVTYFNIRIAKEIHGIFSAYIHLLQKQDNYYNTLIIGAPQTGKTTLLRDISRLISDGSAALADKKVAIIDERSEIAACIDGIPQHNVGKRTDVLDACPKIEGMMMMIRSMSPDVLIVDEIGKKADVDALMDAIHAGVTIICSIHGQSITELKKRTSLGELFINKVFSRYIIVERDAGKSFQMTLLDELANPIQTFPVQKR